MKRVREVFLYSDEDEPCNGSLGLLPVPSDGSGAEPYAKNALQCGGEALCNEKKDTHVGEELILSTGDTQNIAETADDVKVTENGEIPFLGWVEDIKGAESPKKSNTSEGLGRKPSMRVEIVNADNGFQATEMSFQASMEEQARNNRGFKMWLEKKNFVRETLGIEYTGRKGSPVVPLSSGASVVLPKMASGLEKKCADQEVNEDPEGTSFGCLQDSSCMKPIIDETTGEIRAVETLGGYCLTVDERELMDLDKMAQDSEEKADGTSTNGFDEESNSNDEEDEEDERRMDALLTVAVAQRLVDCFQDKEGLEELEAPLKEASQSFLAAVLPLFHHREKCLRRKVGDEENSDQETEEEKGACSRKELENSKTTPFSSLSSSSVPQHTSFGTSSCPTCRPLTSGPLPALQPPPLAQEVEEVCNDHSEGETEKNEVEATCVNRASPCSTVAAVVCMPSSISGKKGKEEMKTVENVFSVSKEPNLIASWTHSSQNRNAEEITHQPFPLEQYSSSIGKEQLPDLDSLPLDDDNVFARAVERPLRRILAIYRRVHRPPKPENVVINGVVMDF